MGREILPAGPTGPDPVVEGSQVDAAVHEVEVMAKKRETYLEMITDMTQRGLTTTAGLKRARVRESLLKDYPFDWFVATSKGKQSPCMGRVGEYFGYGQCAPRNRSGMGFVSQPRYLQTWADLKAASRRTFEQGEPIGKTGFQYDNPGGGTLKRKDRLPRLKKEGVHTVGAARAPARRMCKEQKAAFPVGYIVGVKGHVLAMGCSGKTVADTDRRRNDRRRLTWFDAVTLLPPVTVANINKANAAKRTRSAKRNKRLSAKAPAKRKLKRCPKGYYRNRRTRRCNKR